MCHWYYQILLLHHSCFQILWFLHLYFRIPLFHHSCFRILFVPQIHYYELLLHNLIPLKGQGRNQRELMTRAYWEFLVHGEELQAPIPSTKEVQRLFFCFLFSLLFPISNQSRSSSGLSKSSENTKFLLLCSDLSCFLWSRHL